MSETVWSVRLWITGLVYKNLYIYWIFLQIKLLSYLAYLKKTALYALKICNFLVCDVFWLINPCNVSHKYPMQNTQLLGYRKMAISGIFITLNKFSILLEGSDSTYQCLCTKYIGEGYFWLQTRGYKRKSWVQKWLSVSSPAQCPKWF